MTPFRRFLSFIGPGYLVAVGYMDPGNWATSLAGGAAFGYTLLFVALLSNIMAMLLQSLCARLAIVTGPNMAGKSTFLRQNALIAILAQAGGYVPARAAHVGLVSQVFSRVGAADDLARGRSTFMVEMSETANILHNASDRSLVLMDEVGRGTSTFDGLSLAWAAAEQLARLRAFTLFATHYFELTVLPESEPVVANVHLSATEHNERIVFLHHVLPGPASQSYGLAVAQAVPDNLVGMALAVLLVGAALALSGAIMQALFENPLAEPGLLGVSNGAGVGLIAAVLLGKGLLPGWALGLCAIAGALVITFILLRFARRHLSTSRLLLAGVALGIICSALMTWAVYFSTSFDLRQLMYWMMGGFGGVDWRQKWLVLALLPVFVLGGKTLFASAGVLSVVAGPTDKSRAARH